MDKGIILRELKREYRNLRDIDWKPFIIISLTIFGGLATRAGYDGLLVIVGCFLAGMVGRVVIERFWRQS